jgi:prophage regulatory protein
LAKGVLTTEHSIFNVFNARKNMKVQANPPAPHTETLLRLPAVVARVGLKKSAIYEMFNRNPPEFPRPMRLSRRAVCWPASKIDQWIAERIQAAERS